MALKESGMVAFELGAAIAFLVRNLKFIQEV
jgi:hypothetical protein